MLHGLDADLIMLGLATHEVNFSILREEVLFGKQKFEREREKQKTVLDANGVPDHLKRKRGDFGEHDGDVLPSDQKPLQFLHIATLREYLRIEFEVRRDRTDCRLPTSAHGTGWSDANFTLLFAITTSRWRSCCRSRTTLSA